MENFIRNGIKHNKKYLDSSSLDCEVHLNITENVDKSFYSIEIWDNCTNPSEKISFKNQEGANEDIELYKYLQHFIAAQFNLSNYYPFYF